MKLLMILLLTLFSVPVYAGSVAGEVQRIYPTGNKVYFQLKGDTCKTSNGKYWQFTLDTEVAKAWYAMLLASAQTDRVLVAAYSGGCDTNNHQTISYLYQDF